MLGLIILALANFTIILYGILRISKELKDNNSGVIFIIIDENDDYLEDLLKFLLRQIRKQVVGKSIVILYEISGCQTETILEKLARDLSFIVREINQYQIERANFCCLYYNVLDLRERDNRQEKRLLIEGFLQGCKIVNTYS
jgi:hypothetical protein